MTLGPLGHVAPGPFTTVISPIRTASMMRTGIGFAPLDIVRAAPFEPHASGGKLLRRFLLRTGYF